MAFSFGSYAAAFSQGAALGAFINGFMVTGPTYEGGALDWLSPFSVFTGFGVIVSYALLGSTWLTMKTEGELQARMIVIARRIIPVLLCGIVVVSLWTPLAHGAIARAGSRCRGSCVSRRCRSWWWRPAGSCWGG